MKHKNKKVYQKKVSNHKPSKRAVKGSNPFGDATMNINHESGFFCFIRIYKFF